MTYQTAVFDLDGTLLNTLEDLADAVNYSLKKNKMPLCTITQVCQYVGNGIVKLMERAVPAGNDNPVLCRHFLILKNIMQNTAMTKQHCIRGFLRFFKI